MSQYTAKDNTTALQDIETITGNSGGAAGPDVSGNFNIIGSGSVTVVTDTITHQATISVSGSGLSWNSVAGTTQTMTSNNGYKTTNVALTTLTLPATAAFGDYIALIGNGSGGWSIAQGAGQQVIIGSALSTVGVGGSVSSVNRYDSLELICVVANTTWQALGAPQSAGLTVV
jgi:hypothetical protein